MSAWYVFSAMGFYPFDPCGGEYVLGAALLPEISIKTGEGKVFTITSEGSGTGTVTLNGRAVESPSITHKDVMNGGALCFAHDFKYVQIPPRDSGNTVR